MGRILTRQGFALISLRDMEVRSQKRPLRVREVRMGGPTPPHPRQGRKHFRNTPAIDIAPPLYPPVRRATVNICPAKDFSTRPCSWLA